MRIVASEDVELARCDLIALDGIWFGEEGVHVFDKGPCYCRRYFQLFPGHGRKIVSRTRPCESLSGLGDLLRRWR